MPWARKHLARFRRAWNCVLALAAVELVELDEPRIHLLRAGRRHGGEARSGASPTNVPSAHRGVNRGPRDSADVTTTRPSRTVRSDRSTRRRCRATPACSTFARLPRREDVGRADVAVVGVPFDRGVRYRPGARFGPAHIRQSSRLLRPYNPALNVMPFEAQQVVDAGDIAVEPVRHPRGDRRDRGGAAELSRTAPSCSPSAATTRSPCRCCARCTPLHGPSPCCTSTRTSTRGTPTSASRTRTARRSGARPRRVCSTASTACTSASADRCTRDATCPSRPTSASHDPARVRARDPRRRRRDRADAGPPRRPAGLRLGRHRRARPGPRAGHRHAGGRRHDLARAARDPARPGRRALVGLGRRRRGRAGV